MRFFRRPNRLLCIAFSLVIAAACIGAGQLTMASNPELNNVTPIQVEALKKVDRTNLMGYEFVLSASQFGKLLSQSPEAVQNDWQDRISAVEKYFNCKITLKERDVDSESAKKFKEDFASSVAKNEKYADVIEMTLREFESMYSAGLLAPYEEISDFAKYHEKWNNSCLMVRDNKTYLLSPSTFYFRDYAVADNVLYYNADLLAKFKQPDPQDLLEGEIWDWSVFYAILVQIDSNFSEESPIYGMDALGFSLEQAALSSNECFDVNKVGDTFLFGLDNSHALEALNYVRSFTIDNDFMFQEISSQDENEDNLTHRQRILESFKNENIAFLLGPSSWIFDETALKSTGVNWKMVPFPRNYTKKDYTGMTMNNDDTTVFCISSSNPNIDKSFMIWNALTEKFSGADHDEYMLRTYFAGNKKNYEIYKRCMTSLRYNYLPVLGDDKTVSVLPNYFDVVYDRAILNCTRSNPFTTAEEAIVTCRNEAVRSINDYLNNPRNKVKY